MLRRYAVRRERPQYIAEIHHNGDGLAEPMEQIRTWLNHAHSQPSVFRLSLIPGGTIFRLEFNAVSEAEAFARAFGGQVIGGERAGSLAA
jgi:hypothetical protein